MPGKVAMGDRGLRLWHAARSLTIHPGTTLCDMQWDGTLLRAAQGLMPESLQVPESIEMVVQDYVCCSSVWLHNYKPECSSAAQKRLTCDGQALAVQQPLAQEVLEHSRDPANL